MRRALPLLLLAACGGGTVSTTADGKQHPPWYCYGYTWTEDGKSGHSSACTLDRAQCDSNAAEARATNSYTAVDDCHAVVAPTCYALRTPASSLSLRFATAAECATAAKNEQDLARPCAPF